MSCKLYRGVRVMPGYKATLYVDGTILDLKSSKLDVHDYGADSPEWGYFGSGPSQVAAAILYDLTTDIELTKKYHQQFKREYIANFDQNGFVLLEIQIRVWLEELIRFEGEEDYE